MVDTIRDSKCYKLFRAMGSERLQYKGGAPETVIQEVNKIVLDHYFGLPVDQQTKSVYVVSSSHTADNHISYGFIKVDDPDGLDSVSDVDGLYESGSLLREDVDYTKNPIIPIISILARTLESVVVNLKQFLPVGKTTLEKESLYAAAPLINVVFDNPHLSVILTRYEDIPTRTGDRVRIGGIWVLIEEK